METESLKQTPPAADPSVEVPASTSWPIVLAFGIVLIWAGLVTSAAVSILGAALTVAGTVGWFRDVLPEERHEFVAVDTRVPAVTTRRQSVDRMTAATDRNRASLPVEIYPISAGLRGGLAGSAAMAFLAMLYGIVAQRSIWYPINLLAAGFFPETGAHAVGELNNFHASLFLIAAAIHLLTSALVGLLYGAMLPMLPRRPIVLGGLVAPVLWSGVVHSVLGLVNPVLNRRIDWTWFVISQMGFGVVAGIVVSRCERIRTWQELPFSLRAGMEHSGLRGQDQQGGGQ